jgi:1-acyl-sn-glycerol-3-phosphate acyltransferase
MTGRAGAPVTIPPAARVRGFPHRFPVRDDGARPWRYRIVSAVCRIGLRVVFARALDVTSLEQMPTRGPLLVACNHLSNVDPLIFGGFAPGTLFCMAKRELYRIRLVAWMLGGCNCFPVTRGTADRWALRTSLELLGDGGRLLLFVEGTRAARPGMKRAEAGIGFLARRSRVPVLPIAVWGSERALARGRLFPRRVPITVKVGEPFTPQAARGHTADQATADEIGRHVAELLPPEYRGAYA